MPGRIISNTFTNPACPDIEALRENTVSDIVKECMATSDKDSDVNPRKYGSFLGEDGKWYSIITDIYRGNCYSTAMGWRISAPGKYWYMPGFVVGKTPRFVTECTDYVIKDIEALGRHVYSVIEGDDIPEKLPPAGEGRYWVKTMRSSESNIGGFHIARKDEKSGRWIHRVGWDDRSKVFMRNLEIDYAYDKMCGEYDYRDIRERNQKRKWKSEFIIIMHGDTIPKEISRWEYETMDYASYMAYIPEIDEDDFTEYRPMHALLID